MKRIFVAIKVCPGDLLLKTMVSLKAHFTGNIIKWTDMDNIHITLAFLGDTAENKIPAIITALQRACSLTQKFDIILKSSGLFRNINDPRILWIGIDRSETLIRLNSLIRSGLEETGFNVENSSFSPHITIGRVRRNAATDKDMLSAFLNNYRNIIFQTIKVREVILYESILFQSGPVYKPVRIVPLA